MAQQRSDMLLLPESWNTSCRCYDSHVCLCWNHMFVSGQISQWCIPACACVAGVLERDWSRLCWAGSQSSTGCLVTPSGRTQSGTWSPAAAWASCTSHKVSGSLWGNCMAWAETFFEFCHSIYPIGTNNLHLKEEPSETGAHLPPREWTCLISGAANTQSLSTPHIWPFCAGKTLRNVANGDMSQFLKIR